MNIDESNINEMLSDVQKLSDAGFVRKYGSTKTKLNELYYLQPDGKWKNNADGRSKGKTLEEVKAIHGQIDELSQDTLKSYLTKSKHDSANRWRDDDGKVMNTLPKDQIKKISNRYKGQSRAEKKIDESRPYHGGYTSYSHKEVLQKVHDGDWEAHNDVAPNKLIDVTMHGKTSKRKMIHVHENLDESNNTPYVKPHIEKGSTEQSGWKASNKHGRVKYFRMEAKDSAKKHAGLTEDFDGDRYDRVVNKYRGKLVTTTKDHKGEGGSGYVTGYDPDKKDHVLLTVNAGGVRSKNDNPTKDISVHEKHLKSMNESALNEMTSKVGTYTTKDGSALTLHRSDNDPTHHMLVRKNDGNVVGGYTGTSQEVHKKLTGEGLSGALHEMSKDTLFSYATKAAAQAKKSRPSSKTYSKRLTGMGTAVKKIYDKGQSMREDSEQIDEISKSTLKSYLSKKTDPDREGKDYPTSLSFRKSMESQGIAKGKLGKVYKRRHVPDVKVKATNEDTLNEISNKTMNDYFSKAATNRGKAEKENDTKTVAKRDKGLNRLLNPISKIKGDVVRESLDEAQRGRPPKDPAARAKYDSADHEEQEHIVSQLRKAASISGHHVHFLNGESKIIPASHIHRALDVHDSAKPYEKMSIAHYLHHSPETFHQVIGEEYTELNEDTSMKMIRYTKNGSEYPAVKQNSKEAHYAAYKWHMDKVKEHGANDALHNHAASEFSAKRHLKRSNMNESLNEGKTFKDNKYGASDKQKARELWKKIAKKKKNGYYDGINEASEDFHHYIGHNVMSGDPKHNKLMHPKPFNSRQEAKEHIEDHRLRNARIYTARKSDGRITNILNHGPSANDRAYPYSPNIGDHTNIKHLKESEDLNELSKNTLASYVNKALPDVHNKAYRAGKSEGSGKGYDTRNIVGGIMRQHNIDKAVKKIMAKESLDEAKAASPIAGTRLISRHDGANGYHNEVRYNPEWQEHSVHHYQNGNHLGEGPVSYHGEGKEGRADATDTANHNVHNYHVKNGKVMMKEELNEISRELAGKYFNKVNTSNERNKLFTATDKKRSNRQEGKHLAMSKRAGVDSIFGKKPKVIATESIEQIDELSKGTLTSYMKKAEKSMDTLDKEAKPLKKVIDKENTKIHAARSEKEYHRAAGGRAHSSRAYNAHATAMSRADRKLKNVKDVSAVRDALDNNRRKFYNRDNGHDMANEKLYNMKESVTEEVKDQKQKIDALNRKTKRQTINNKLKLKRNWAVNSNKANENS